MDTFPQWRIEEARPEGGGKWRKNYWQVRFCGGSRGRAPCAGRAPARWGSSRTWKACSTRRSTRNSSRATRTWQWWLSEVGVGCGKGYIYKRRRRRLTSSAGSASRCPVAGRSTRLRWRRSGATRRSWWTSSRKEEDGSVCTSWKSPPRRSGTLPSPRSESPCPWSWTSVRSVPPPEIKFILTPKDFQFPEVADAPPGMSELLGPLRVQSHRERVPRRSVVLRRSDCPLRCPDRANGQRRPFRLPLRQVLTRRDVGEVKNSRLLNITAFILPLLYYHI